MPHHFQIMNRLLLNILFTLSLCICLASCSISNHIPEGEYFLEGYDVQCDNERLMKSLALSDYVTQNTNTKWFGARVPLRVFCLAGNDTTKLLNRFFKRIGEAPVLYDSIKSAHYINDINLVLNNAGYLKAKIEEEKHIKRKNIHITYRITPGAPYTIENFYRSIDDPALAELLCGDDTTHSLIKKSKRLDAITLNSERNRINTNLRNNGYFKFTKDNINFLVDTVKNSPLTDLTLHISNYQPNSNSPSQPHKQYTIGDVTFVIDNASVTSNADTTKYKGYNIVYPGYLPFRKKMLVSRSTIKPGELFKDNEFKYTYNSINQLSAVALTSIQTTERKDNDTIDCVILVNHNKPNSLGVDVEATNSAGDLGAALSTTFQNNNFLRGSETFTFKLRGAYEAITGLEGYEGNNYIEFGGEARLAFPNFLLPYVKRSWSGKHNATSEVVLQYNLQNRPEFQRRVFTAGWRYKWQSINQQIAHRFDLMEINYVLMPWISKTFKEHYLDDIGKTNAILRYNYENLLITKTGYTYSYNSLGPSERTYGKNAYTVKFNIEASGFVLDGLTSLIKTETNNEGSRTFCGIAYAEYVRGDFDYSKSIRIDKNNSIALHGALGVAYPYGNSSQLPFEKRYFAGGANSVRGWSVRSLGPGSYNGHDKGINFLNQSGDIKLDLSLEYRAQLFWKFSGALFVDAGNIWTIRKYEDQPGGEFRFNKFYEQIAMSYGIGLRMDANFFIVRFDAGMKAINPALQGREHYPITHPNFDRDFAFHFAVGMPF